MFAAKLLTATKNIKNGLKQETRKDLLIFSATVTYL